MLQMRVDAWLRAFMDNPERPRRDDVHLDQLDPAFRDPSVWATAAVECLVIAAQVVGDRSWPITVAVEFFLQPGRAYEPLDAVELSELSNRWSHTPPALTVYRDGAEPWAKSESFKPAGIATGKSGGDKLMFQSFFQQWYDEAEGDYDRRLWLVAKAR